jgi:hypothetical protein
MKLVDRSALKFILLVFVSARVALSAWTFALALLAPTVLQNLDLFGAPTLAVFDLQSSERFAYSRALDDRVLTFRAGARGEVVDAETGSVWNLRAGRAEQGALAGRAFAPAAFSVEEIFPYHGVASESNPLLALWQRFDTIWYLKIAAHGYAADGSTVYLPLYPVLIRALTFITGNAMFAALLVSNLALIGALVLFYRLTAQHFDDASARRAVVYLLIFPTGFFLFAAYTEALFLFFALAMFDAAERAQWGRASVWGAFAALTRLQGVLLVVPLAFWLWQNAEHGLRITRALRVLRFTPLLLIPLATLAYLGITNYQLLGAYESQLHARFVLPWDNFAAMFALIAHARASWIDWINLGATILFAGMIVLAWRRMPRAYGMFAALMWLAPLLRMTTTQPLVSMTRYALAFFPVFMLWGACGKNAWINRAILYLALPLNLFFSAQFVMWGWVG